MFARLPITLCCNFHPHDYAMSRNKGINLCSNFSLYVESELDKASIWNWLAADPANITLGPAFDLEVRRKLAQDAKLALEHLAASTSVLNKSEMEIPPMKNFTPDPELSCIKDFRFKRSHQKQIIAALDKLVSNLIVPRYQREMATIASELIGHSTR